MNWAIPLFDPDLDEREAQAVAEVVHSKWLTMGDRTAEFERRFAALCDAKHAIAVNSATAALHLAVAASGIGAGDDVIVPSLTFVATANAVRYCRARPVFADVGTPLDWNVSAASLEAVRTPQTRAVIVVHYAGYPCAMDEIAAWAASHDIVIIEDVAHAPGASVSGRSLGTWGIGCFSFFSNKNMTTGEGGMVVVDDDDIAARVRLLRSHGMTTLTLDRHKGHAFSYDVVDLGFNYRTSELNAALGLCQLDRLPELNARRKALTARYREHLSPVRSVEVPFASPLGAPTPHIMPVLLARGVDRSRVMALMRDAGIQTSIHYRPVDTFTAYVTAGLGPSPSVPLTHDIGERELTLPLYPSMTDRQVDTVCTTLAEATTHANV